MTDVALRSHEAEVSGPVAGGSFLVSLMAFVPLIRTRLMTRLCAMASACGPFTDPASRGLDDDVVGSFQGERAEFREDRRPQPRISFSNTHVPTIRSISSPPIPALTQGWI